MERHLYEDEFEGFLKEKADQYKLYPSDKVWTGIYNFLHLGRKWNMIGGTLVLLAILSLISLELVLSPHKTYFTTTRSATALASHVSLMNDVENNTPESTQYTPLVIGETILKPFTLKKNIKISQVFIPLVSTAYIPETIELPSLPHFNILPKNSEQKSSTNWLQERAAMKLGTKQRSWFNVQFYLSPTISYRKLQNNDPKARLPFNSHDVNNLVNQRPAIGLELGSALLFNFSDKLVVKTGLQLNYARYNIKAYKSYRERAPITLSSTGGGIGRVDTIITYSSLRNFDGYTPENLQNQYVQVSLPIGAEWKLLGNNRFQLNVAGTIQPTYLLMNNSYMLSSDYAHYTKEPSLVRRWNVNAGLETYLSYKAGGLRWQLGPQFRYQLLSTYIDRYPIREYLMEYGFKIGVSKTLK